MDVKEAGKGGGGGGGSSRTAGPGETVAFRTVWVAAACMTLPTLVFVSGLYKPTLTFIASVGSGVPRQPREGLRGGDADAAASWPSDEPRDKYLGGLLATGFVDEESCQSRYQSTMYRKPSPHKPSPYLIRRLRNYEEHHRRCAPHTGGFNKTLQYLKTQEASSAEEMECRYVLWSPGYGLGNRILSLASAFLYALLTDRVVLIDRGKDMATLFCEPFPNTTWLLPKDFPISNFDVYNRNHPLSYGTLVKNNNIGGIADGAGDSSPLRSLVYVHLLHDYQTEDMHFYCEPDQAILRKVPWVFIRSNLYYVPAFFLNQDFEPELSRMFPEKETVFHHLSRYLFHPTNNVWEMVTKYYRTYLAEAKERLGLQIRILTPNSPFDIVFPQLMNCTLGNGILPEVDSSRSYTAETSDPKKAKAVLITSLYPEYFDKIQDMYRKHPAADGTPVALHQPSSEKWQQTDRPDHDMKAWAEMILLSLTDVLVTSARSTFGYVGQGLGGITPWVLVQRPTAAVPQPPCVREVSMEPCLLSPTWYVCREKKNGDNGKVVPYVTHCRDEGIGLKLVDRN